MESFCTQLFCLAQQEHPANAGLVVAEIELRSEDEVFERPTWLGEEVSGQRKYSNSALSLFPFKDWI